MQSSDYKDTRKTFLIVLKNTRADINTLKLIASQLNTEQQMDKMISEISEFIAENDKLPTDSDLLIMAMPLMGLNIDSDNMMEK